MLKCILQSPHLKSHTKTIAIDQSLSNSALYEHRYLQNIKKLYKHAGKCDDQKKLNIFLRLLWFLLLKDSPTTVLYLQ